MKALLKMFWNLIGPLGIFTEANGTTGCEYQIYKFLFHHCIEH